MALVPAVLSLQWVSNYDGPHRVCYRVVGAPTYICTQPGTPGPGFHPLCGGLGSLCYYDIDILVDNETCDQVDYEIYVQPACETEISLVGRIPLNLSFIPDPACNRYNVLCGAVGIDDGTVTAPGAGYTIGTSPLPLVGGDGVGATAEAVVTGARDVIGYLGDGLGTGYNDGVYGNAAADNVVVFATPAGLELNVTVAAGTLTVNSIASGGSGYYTGDTVKINETIVGIPVTPEIITVTADDTGTVTAINVLTPGSGYTVVPVPDFSGFAPGAGAAGTVALAPCGALTVYDCNGVTGTILPPGTFNIGEGMEMCGSALPTIPSEFTVVEDGNCLCNCIEQDLQNTNPGGTIDYTYIDCNGAVQTGTLAGSASTGDICMVDGSLITVVNLPAVEAIVVVGPCDAV
jgi:hypothetical protein